MAKYENGVDTRNKILQCCRKLFYEKGYEQTTFKDISETAEVNQGLIVYHFKSKTNLAKCVFQYYIKESMSQIEEFFKDCDALTQSFINDFLYFRLLFENEAFRNFMNTCCATGILKKDMSSIQDETYERYYWELMDCITDDAAPDSTMLEATLVIFDGIKDTYTCYVCEKFQSMRLREVAENYISIYCRMFGIEEINYGPKMLEAELRANQVNVSIDFFEFRLGFRQGRA